MYLCKQGHVKNYQHFVFSFRLHSRNVTLEKLIKNNLNFLFQSMNDPRALRNRVLKYLIPVFIICIVFNITKFFEIDVEYIPINSTNINNTTQRFSTTSIMDCQLRWLAAPYLDFSGTLFFHDFHQVPWAKYNACEVSLKMDFQHLNFL